jgi:copper resistance protein D
VALLVDTFGFLSVLLRGLALSAQSLTIGGIAFLLLLAQPLAPLLGAAGAPIIDRTRRLLAWSALALAAIEVLTVALQVSILVGTLDVSPIEAATTLFAGAALTTALCAIAIAIVAIRARRAIAPAVLGLLTVAILMAQVVPSHAAARIDGRLMLGLAGFAHMAGAAVWIGGLPYLGLALAHTAARSGWYLIGRRYSLMSMVSVAALLCGGIAMAVGYVGSFDALYGTGYGVMVSTKAILLGGLLLLGAMNFLTVRRLRRDPSAPVARLRRFAEAELGIGLTVLFAAASLTSQPPGVDLTADRVAFSEIVARLTPTWPRLTSPPHHELSRSRLNIQLASADSRDDAPRAFIPGEGLVPPRNAMDRAWSEFNHHWAGLIVVGMGVLALLERSRSLDWARHWPLFLAGLALPMVARADPEVWPVGHLGLLESLRDPEVVQHRLMECLTAVFGVLEWRVRTGRTANPRAALIFPLLCALGGALLLTHSHALANLRDQLLSEISHVPLALAAMVAAWARWIELRLDGRASRVAGWIWPVAFVATGVTLLLYREQ